MGLTPLPHFAVNLAPPDLRPHLAGNTGIRGFTTRDSGRPGPHVALVCLMHGNEFAGAIALDRLLRGGVRPLCGRLTFGFVNIEAFLRFDPRQPTASRFVEEDLNRVWDEAVLDGSRQSSELARARQIRPLIDSVDLLLDLHSMLWPSDPLMLCGPTAKGRALADAIGAPGLAVADHGHAGGRRLIDYARFAGDDGPAANLAEAGLHWEPDTVGMSLACATGLLRHAGIIDGETPPPVQPRRHAEVTATITATTSNFSFVQNYRGGDIIPYRNTVIALDGSVEIRTPYDDCLLVMPSLRPSRGHTAVRLARVV